MSRCVLGKSGRTPGDCKPGTEHCVGCGWEASEAERRRSDIRAGRGFVQDKNGLWRYRTVRNENE